MIASMQQNNKFFSKHTATGFSFIEILVALLLLSIFASFVVPRIFGNRKGVTKKQFFSDFSHVISDTLYQAITTKKIHQVFFDFNNREISVKIYHADSSETDKHKQFKKVPPGNFHSSLIIPEQLTIQNFSINGTDAMAAGKTTNDAWFYIMPDGTSQAVIMNIQDEQEESPHDRFSIVINPFYSQVKLHDAFTKV
jgi:prepilin-type N-terminal cleavage/methylation domain-containing protein